MWVGIIGTLCFIVLFFINWFIGRSLIYPGVALSGIWTIEFVVQIVAAGILYPVSWSALTVFVIAGLAFTAGAVVGNGGIRRAIPVMKTKRNYGSDRVVLGALGLVLIAALPAFLAEIRGFSNAPLFSPIFFLEVRQGFLEMADTLNRVPLINNAVAFANFTAMLAYAVTDGARRNRKIVFGFIGLAIFYNLLTGAKIGVVNLAIALFAIQMILHRRMAIRSIALVVGVIVLLFALISAARIGVAERSMTIEQVGALGWENFVGYLASGPVAFSKYLETPDLIPLTWGPWVFFERLVNYFAPVFNIPSQHAEFVDIGPGMLYNTYTAYFIYYEYYGIGGVIAFMFGLGVLCTVIYRKALSGIETWIVVYALLFFGVIMTIFGESLMTSLNPILKLAALGALLRLARRLRFRRPQIVEDGDWSRRMRS